MIKYPHNELYYHEILKFNLQNFKKLKSDSVQH